jgi:hypothetical protein
MCARLTSRAEAYGGSVWGRANVGPEVGFFMSVQAPIDRWTPSGYPWPSNRCGRAGGGRARHIAACDVYASLVCSSLNKETDVRGYVRIVPDIRITARAVGESAASRLHDGTLQRVCV